MRWYQYRVAGSVPRRSSTSLSRVVVSNRRMRVPFREADAATLPGWFSATHAISLWWALMVKGADDVPGLVLDRSWRGEDRRPNAPLLETLLPVTGY